MSLRTTVAFALTVSCVVAVCRMARADDVGAAANSIRVIVVGLRSNNGEVDCALFNSAEGFPGDTSKAIKTVKSKIENEQATCTFVDVAPGDYAVSEFHDENGNGKLDTNFIGMPKEGVGASNDAAGHMGPPKFDAARFHYLGGRAVMTIHTKYLIAPL
jgi:uncharacterized protein (DUF2141 family)